MQKKLLAIVMSVALVAMIVPSGAFALTAEELAAQIAALQAQLTLLTSQLNGTPSTPASGSCTVSFNANLYYGLRGGNVKALQEFLISKGHLAAGLNTSYFGPLTRAAVSAYQKAKSISPTAGYFGPLTRAAANADCGGVTPSPSPTTSPSPSPSPTPSADAVSLSSAPAASAVAKNSQNVVFFSLKFAAGSTAYTVSKIVVSRGGVSADTDIAAIKLYDGSTQIGSTQALNTTTHKATFNVSWNVPANTEKILTVKANIYSAATVGDSVTLGIAAIADIVSTSAGLAGSFPIVSNAMTIAGVSVGTLNVDVQAGLVPLATILSGAVEQEIAAWKFAAVSEGFSVKSIKVTHVGSATRTDVSNLKLKVSGAQLGSTVAELGSDNTATFDLSASPLIINSGQSKYVYAYADTAAGINTSRTVIFEITQATDVDAYGSNSGGGVTITYSSGTAFSRQTGATMTIGQGTLSVALDSATNPAVQSYVLGTTNRLVAAFKFSTGSTEGARITELTLTQASASGTATDISNISLYDGSTLIASGSMVGSTVKFGANTIGWDSGGGLFDMPVSTNKVIQVKADVPSGATAGTSRIGLKVNAAADLRADGLTSQYDLPSGSVTLGSPTPTGNGHTISSYGTLVVSLSSTTPSAQTYVKGVAGKEFTKINFTAGTGEDMLVSAVTIRCYEAGTGTGDACDSGDVTSVKLMKSDGTQFGSTVASPTASASFSGSLTVPAGTTVILTVVADVPSSSTTSSVHFDLPGAGTVADDITSTGVYSTADVTETGSATGNLMTIGTGTLTISASSSPADQTVVLSSTGVNYVSFVMTAGTAEDIRITSVKLTRTSSGTGADADISSIALYDGTTRLTAYKPWDTGGGTVTFSASDFLNSLGIDVSKGQQKVIGVYADTPSGAVNAHLNALGIDLPASVTVSGLTSGASITPTLSPTSGVNYAVTGAGEYEVTLTTAGSLTLTTNPDTPIIASQAVGAEGQGKSAVSFTKVLFTAIYEAVDIKSIRIIVSGGADGDFSAVKIYDGTTQVGSTGYLSGGLVTFNFLPGAYVRVLKNQTKVLTLVGDLAGIGSTSGASSGDAPKLCVDAVSPSYVITAEGAESKGSISVAGTTDLCGTEQILRQSVPTLAAGSLPSTLLSSGTKTLYKWTVSADAIGNIGWKAMMFHFSGSIHTDATTVRTIGTDDTTTIKTDGVYMIVATDGAADTKLIDESSMKVYNSATNTQVAGAWYFRTDTDANGGTYAVFVATNEEVISYGTTNTYELRGDLAYGGYTGDAVLVRVPDLASSVATTTYALAFGTDNAADSCTSATTVTKSFAWSDRSAAGHAVTTSDWSDDYKVPSFPLSTLTLSK
ncbi:MAG: peptidoglycan-binding domain-containing protein [bacterium]|nr:peptidoglycan-binding domain-containing protein [bacterium]